MTLLKTRDGKGITFTGTCTEVISIDDVVEHSANKAWRSNSEKSVVEEKNDLSKQMPERVIKLNKALGEFLEKANAETKRTEI